jgi:hypothetical protein
LPKNLRRLALLNGVEFIVEDLADVLLVLFPVPKTVGATLRL